MGSFLAFVNFLSFKLFLVSENVVRYHKSKGYFSGHNVLRNAACKRRMMHAAFNFCNRRKELGACTIGLLYIMHSCKLNF